MDALENVLPPAPAADPTTGRILDAALAEFLRAGIRGTRLEEVARLAGVSRVTVHRRFPGKQELVSAVMLREARAVLTEAALLIDAEPTIPDKVATGFVFALDYARTGTLSPLLRDDHRILPSYTTHGEPLVGLLRAFFAALLPGISPQAADVVARLVISYGLSDTPTADLRSPAGAAAFARAHLAPIVTAHRPG